MHKPLDVSLSIAVLLYCREKDIPFQPFKYSGDDLNDPGGEKTADFDMCPACRGTKTNPWRTKPCNKCQGDGLIEISYKTEDF